MAGYAVRLFEANASTLELGESCQAEQKFYSGVIDWIEYFEGPLSSSMAMNAAVYGVRDQIELVRQNPAPIVIRGAI